MLHVWGVDPNPLSGAFHKFSVIFLKPSNGI
jgi:hypothetical protein